MSLTYSGQNLIFGGIRVSEMAKKFGTPIYAYDLDIIGRQIERHKAAFDGEVDIHFAVKANANETVLKFMRSQKIGADVVSGGELRWALKNGFKGSDVIFSGVAKSHEEIRLALKNRIKMMNVESPEELERIASIAKKSKIVARVGFRFNPDVEVNTHPYITTGFRENKFGMDSSFLPKIRELLTKNRKHLALQGISLHIGSQITEFAPIKEAIQKTKPVFRDFQDLGAKYFDIGGGIGINYGDGSPEPQSLEEYGKMVRKELRDIPCRISCEPGRVLVGEAGILIASVEYIKTTPHKTFVILNTGMHHLMRPTLYEAYHRVLPATRRSGPEVTCDVVGPICESSDFLAKSRTLPPLKSGDLVVIAESGAYGFTMSSFYNLHALPREITILKKKMTSKPFKILQDLKLLPS